MYDERDRLTGVTFGATGATFGYDANDNRTSVALPLTTRREHH